MNFADSLLVSSVVDWLTNGMSGMSWWQVVLYTLVTTHITIASVTIYLHRHQAHRAMDLHPVVAHLFRFWLWVGTGMNTAEWVGVHRKHHAKCETQDDPHSPQAHGISTVLLRGVELYQASAAQHDTMSKFTHGCPNDWLERHVYARYTWQGVGLLMLANIAMFGAIGLTIWVVQMLWIPITAAGIINGIGHYWGYRNFEAPDASTNISPWGIIIGGEELHNNHHTYPTSAKFSVKPYEFDLGWFYISIMTQLGLAHVRKTPPKLMLEANAKPVADEKSLEALITNRYEVMAAYARDMRATCKAELAALKAKGSDLSALKTAKQWLHRDDDKVPASARMVLAQARAAHPVLDKMVTMREELRDLWSNTSRSREQLTADLAAWCKRAEASNIAALQRLSEMVRMARA